MLQLAHTFVDLAHGSVPALLPFLIVTYNISYTAATGLAFAHACVSILCQPFFGILADKSAKPWFICLALLLNGVGMCMVAFCSSYWLLFLAMVICGLGAAVFHPEGGKLANIVSGGKAGGLSIFTSGGNIGFTLGPLFVTACMLTLGFKGLSLYLIPCILIAAVMLRQLKNLEISTQKKAEVQGLTPDKRSDWRGFAGLVSILSLKSVLSYGFMMFLAIFWVSELGRSPHEGSIALSIMSVCGVISMLACGFIADRIGFRRILLIFAFMIVPLYLIFAFNRSLAVAVLLIILIPIVNNGPQSTLIAMSQACIPRHVGLASGITLGIGTSFGGLTAPLFGLVGDAAGIPVVMFAIAGMSFFLLLLILYSVRREKI